MTIPDPQPVTVETIAALPSKLRDALGMAELRHTWYVLIYGVSLDNYRDVYTRDILSLQCRHCGIVRP